MDDEMELVVTGYGDGYGYSVDYGAGSGYGSGYGTGYGDGNGYGFGVGFSYGVGFGDGYGFGDSYGTDVGYGYGYGYGYGIGYGFGDSGGYGFGSGYGFGDSAGYGDGNNESITLRKLFFAHLLARHALMFSNAEIKKEAIESIGYDRFFHELDARIVHKDTDGCGNPRVLLRIPISEAEKGYIQAVRVTCPTTGRIYNLGVSPDCQTCQEAVASTFGLKPDDYHPDRES